MEAADWALIITVLFGAGGIAAFFKGKTEAQKLGADAQSRIIQDLQAENARLLHRVQKMDDERAKLEEDIKELKAIIEAVAGNN